MIMGEEIIISEAVIEKETSSSTVYYENSIVANTVNKLKNISGLILAPAKRLKEILIAERVNTRDSIQIENARKIEVMSRARSFKTVRTCKIDIVDKLTERRAEAERSIVAVTGRIQNSMEHPLEDLLEKAILDTIPEPKSKGKTGQGVNVRPGQPIGCKMIHESEFQHGFRVKKEAGSSVGRGPLGYWRKRIPECLLDLVIPDQELYASLAISREAPTLANHNGHILTFLAWIVWKFFYYMINRGLQGIAAARELLPPWRSRIIIMFGSDMLAIHGYALSSVKNTVTTVRDWMTTYAAHLVKVSNTGELAAWPKQMENATRKLHKTGRKYDATKARPCFDIAEKWKSLSTDEKTFLNIWCQVGCRWDTISMARKSHFAVMPVNMMHRLSVPEQRKGKSFRNLAVDSIRINEAICLFIEKEKVDSHESRWIPFECNCCSKEDSDVYIPGANIHEGFYVQKQGDESINTDFCLYHGRFGFKNKFL